MSLLSNVLGKYDAPQKAKDEGVYPYFRPIESDQDTVVTIDGKRVLMFGSNSYLGLTNHPVLKEGAIKAIEKYGTGCAGSRFLNGTLDIHLELEDRLAKLVHKEAALVYATGFTVNSGVVFCITGREDYLIFDEFDHASIIEGKRLSFSKTLKYRHNDMDALEKVLKKCEPDRVKVIVIDGVFSMEGDVAKLPEIVELSKKYGSHIGIQLGHAGRKCGISSLTTLAPSAIAFNEDYNLPKEMDQEDIERIVEAFKAAAVRSLEAGYDAETSDQRYRAY